MSILKPVKEVDVHLIRGDSWNVTLGFSGPSFEDVLQNPQDYKFNWTFRDRQNDNLTPHLILSGDIVAVSESATSCGSDSLFNVTFSATDNETQQLPMRDLVYYCELTRVDGTFVKRLFQGSVKVSD